MKITLKFLEEHKVCQEGLDYFKKNFTDDVKCDYLISVLNYKNKHNWSNWLISKLLKKENIIKYAIFSAELVLHIFENKYPEDKRPRKAIDAAKEYLKNPNKKTAADAATAAAAAYAAATAAAAAYAAAADASAADTAATAAAAADDDTAATAYVAAAAAAYAAAADSPAYAAAKKETYEKIMNYGLELIKEQEINNEN
jgi:hypothetical protein